VDKKKINWIDVADITTAGVFWGGLLAWIGYSIYTNGFTEPVLWALSGLGCFVLTILIFGASRMDASAVGNLFFIFIIWACFISVLGFRLVQVLVL
jgi:hypothetical protein